MIICFTKQKYLEIILMVYPSLFTNKCIAIQMNIFFIPLCNDLIISFIFSYMILEKQIRYFSMV